MDFEVLHSDFLRESLTVDRASLRDEDDACPETVREGTRQALDMASALFEGMATRAARSASVFEPLLPTHLA